MISKEKVDKYIKSIPPLEEALKECLGALKEGDLQKAAAIASTDPALMFYLKDLTTKPIYGFDKEIKDPKQIFGILGLTSALAVVESFLFSKIMPDKFFVFDLDKREFLDFQDQMVSRWIFILDKLKIENPKPYTTLASLICSTAIFADRLFADNRDLINELQEHSNVNYNSILEKLAGINVFQIAKQIALKWEMDEKAVNVLKVICTKELSKFSDEDIKLAQFLYLLFFYIVSKPEYLKAGLNGFIELDFNFIGDTVTEFNTIMEKYDTPGS